MNYLLQNYQRSNQDTCIVQRPVIHEGDWVQEGELLADCAASSGGELALGQNLLIAYMPWEGYNYEDAILISERLVAQDLYTSIHIERYEMEIRKTKYGIEQITNQIPDVSKTELSNLDSRGIIEVGTWVTEGDILVGKVTPIQKKYQSPYQKLLYTILEKELPSLRDSSLRTPKGLKAKVIQIQVFTHSATIEKTQMKGPASVQTPSR
jgi:DNA-directed RNA polymerase subunit beta